MNDQEEPQYSPFRSPKFNAIERLVCSYLIESLSASQLESVIFVCKAGMMLSEQDAEKIQLNTGPLRGIYTVAQRLFSAKPMLNQHEEVQYYEVHTGSLNYDEDVAPWAKIRWYPHYSQRPFVTTGSNYRVSGKDDPEEYHKALAEGSPKEAFDHTNRNLIPSGYEMLVSDFLEYAIPFTQQVAGLLTELISPETYTDMLTVYKGARKND